MKRQFFLATMFVFAGVVTSLADTDAQDHALIAVNLYAGNQYWFAVGAADPAKKIAVNVYDETGRLLRTEHYEGGDRAAAGFSPSDSGQYFVSVDLVEGGSSSFCLIYSYK